MVASTPDIAFSFWKGALWSIDLMFPKEATVRDAQSRFRDLRDLLTAKYGKSANVVPPNDTTPNDRRTSECWEQNHLTIMLTLMSKIGQPGQTDEVRVDLEYSDPVTGKQVEQTWVDR